MAKNRRPKPAASHPDVRPDEEAAAPTGGGQPNAPGGTSAEPAAAALRFPQPRGGGGTTLRVPQPGGGSNAFAFGQPGVARPFRVPQPGDAARPLRVPQPGGGSRPLSFPVLPQAAAAARRQIIVFERGALGAGLKMLQGKAGLKLASAADYKAAALNQDDARSAGGYSLPGLDVACVTTDDPGQRRAAVAAAVAASVGQPGGGSRVLSVSPVRALFALTGRYGRSALTAPLAGPWPDYLLGFRDGVLSTVPGSGGPGSAGGGGGPVGPNSPPGGGGPGGTPFDESRATWGLQVTMAVDSRFTGRGVKVAVLDTGIALGHPDLAGRLGDGQAASFVPGVATADDGNGHGSHCAGTVCGPARPLAGPRYGVAPDAQLYVGKVLGDDGIGYDDYFLAGLEWAVANGCRVVSMSLGGEPGPEYDPTFEIIAQRVLDAGTLIVAAAGNESQRSAGWYAPVAHPANCPSLLAVAALDQALGVADFSNRGLHPDGGQVDIAGPGVDVLSSYPGDGLAYLSGTSMATPHVAGIAALYAEANPASTARDLWSLLSRRAVRLEAASADVGVGLARAP